MFLLALTLMGVGSFVGLVALAIGFTFFPTTFFFTTFFTAFFNVFFSGRFIVFFFLGAGTGFLARPLFFFLSDFAVAMEGFLPSEKMNSIISIKVIIIYNFFSSCQEQNLISPEK